ncbi:MAG: TonB family protein [Cellvibrionaceae bacterium]
MKATRLSRVGICLLLILAASHLHAQPSLNGIAVSTEFGKERFIAALYSDVLTTDANELLGSSGRRRMELKVVADSLSARSVNSMWIEGMAINNPGSALEAQAQNLAKLNNLIRRRLLAGDVLSFDAESGNGTVVTLNGIRLGTINSDDFFPMLLRTWIGSIPLSSEFKDSLLAGGGVDGGLADRYARIEPDDARIEVVAGWVAPEPPAPEVVSSAPIEPPRPAPPPRPTIPTTASDDTSDDPDDSDEQQEVAGTQSTEPASEPVVAASQAQNQQNNPRQAAESNTGTPAPARVTPAPQPAAASGGDGEDEEEAMVTAESLVLRQRYISDVMRKTWDNMRYPQRAQERGQQGSIRLAVTVARNGEVQDIQLVEESRYSMLNREAQASVERASPFPEVPDGVGDESFSFGIPITFRLQ